MMQRDKTEVLRLKVVAEANLDALIRVLQSLQASHVLPLRVSATRASVRGVATEILEIEIETSESDLSPDVFRLLIAQINQLPLALIAAN